MQMHPVKKARLGAGLNYRELAETCSPLSIPTLVRIESGEQVSALSMYKAANALGLDGDELLEAMHEESKKAAQASPEKQPA